jgi:hypothetical protein
MAMKIEFVVFWGVTPCSVVVGIREAMLPLLHTPIHLHGLVLSKAQGLYVHPHHSTQRTSAFYLDV